jgi:hypothetical protein
VQSKAIQELFDPAYGRMNATLGVELPFTSALTQTTIPLGFVDPVTETVADGETQFWKITHNGVDAHPVHFHLVNLQVINRIGWDGTIKAPHGDEFGWKETIKMNPLEDIVVAVRAKKPVLRGNTADVAGNTIVPSNAFGLPISSRRMDPSQPLNANVGFTQIDPNTGIPATVTNQVADYGWEYVWHCHILGHEENDFMRPVKFTVKEAVPAAPTLLTATASGTGALLNWTDTATTEYAYKVERAIVTNNKVGTFTDLTATALPLLGAAPVANANKFTDTTTLTAGTTYQYKVTAIGAAGNSAALTVNYTAPAAPVAAPAAANVPSSVAVQRTGVATATVNWAYTASGSTTGLSFSVQVSNNGGAWTDVSTGNAINARSATVSLGATAAANSLNALYRVNVMKTTGTGRTAVTTLVGSSSATASLNDTVAPAAATLTSLSKAAVNNRGTRTGTAVTINWTDTANNNATYTVQFSTDGGTTWSNVSTTVAGNATTATHNIAGYSPATVVTYTYRVLAVNSAVIAPAVVASNTSTIAIP